MWLSKRIEDERDRIQASIDIYRAHNNGSCGDLSDGYHTFDELYHHRAMLFATLCMTVLKDCCWKSLLHHDRTMYPGMFIVGANTEYGQISYHYNIDPYWSIFVIPDIPTAPEFDGHTPTDVVNRLYQFAVNYGKPKKRGDDTFLI